MNEINSRCVSCSEIPVPDTPTSTKITRDSKESNPDAAAYADNSESKQATAERKGVLRENIHESDREQETERKVRRLIETAVCVYV